MKSAETTLKIQTLGRFNTSVEGNINIQTLGRFNITVDGNSVATDWPDETSKVIFCSLLSPLDLYITWDRICRTIWNVHDTRTNRRRLKETILQPLNSFLIKELGYNPLVAEREGIRIDHHGIHVDAHEFHSTVVEGIRLVSLGNNVAAFEKFSRANSLYAGRYLPDIPGKIIANARNELEALYRTMVSDVMALTRNSGVRAATAGQSPSYIFQRSEDRFKR